MALRRAWGADMSDPMKTPGASTEDRDAAVREWEHQINSPLLADTSKKRASGIAIAVIAAAVMAVIWYMKHTSAEASQPKADVEQSIADRKPVPKLKEVSTAAVPAVAASEPHAAPGSAAQADDPLMAQREEAQRQRQEQERKLLAARLKSAIMAQSGQGQTSALGTTPAVVSGDGQPDASGLGGGGERGAQDSNSRFARAVSGGGVAVSKASQIADLDYKVLQGKLIEAVLEPRAISDLPGTICATVQRDVYGAQGRKALIPWGSSVCGVYSAELRKGQDRLFAVWNTVRRPDGVQVTLDSIGADQLGTAGMGGVVDTHFAQIFGMAALLSIIGAGSSTVGVGGGDQYNSAAYYRQSVQQAAAQTSQQILQPYANMPPTVTVPAGSRVRIYVNRDLDFTPIYQAEIEASRHVKKDSYYAEQIVVPRLSFSLLFGGDSGESGGRHSRLRARDVPDRDDLAARGPGRNHCDDDSQAVVGQDDIARV
ncbi:VirB10 protein [Cupriavidus basilensis OR16]|uniref:VirB10 protein n=1 Tax=Cupriavidus basilensis OR16 TaxID=1127483 RepID=H1RZV1_9BURK|nr:VirB10 protein [Cupriavidus basilensis OR16]